MSIRFATIAATCLMVTACGTGEEPWVSPVGFDTARAVIHTEAGETVPLLVEVARTEAQKRQGLMSRPALDGGSGMVFLYDTIQAGDRGFWMWRTRIPLDIAFLDTEGRIDTILAMDPCESPNPEWCPIYEPGTEYASALEVNRGWFREHGIGPGARVEIDFEGAGDR